ncbi:hypothetical protein PENANT_c134G09755, partial [Penicillium antarcticum]
MYRHPPRESILLPGREVALRRSKVDAKLRGTSAATLHAENDKYAKVFSLAIVALSAQPPGVNELCLAGDFREMCNAAIPESGVTKAEGRAGRRGFCCLLIHHVLQS